MRRGRHCATFTLRSLDGGAAILGVVGVGFDPAAGTKAYASPQGWMLYTSWGDLFHAGRSSHWEGQPEYAELKEGDVVVRLHPPPLPLRVAHGCLPVRATGPARPRRGHRDGVGQRRAEGRHGTPWHDRRGRRAGGSARGAAALGGRPGSQCLGGDRRRVVAARLSQARVPAVPPPA